MVRSGLVISPEIIDACKKVQSNHLDGLVLGVLETNKLSILKSFPKNSKKHPYRSIATSFDVTNARL